MPNNTVTKTELQLSLSNDSLPKTIGAIKFTTLSRTGNLLAELHNEGVQDVVAYFNTLVWSELSDRNQTRMAYVLEAFLGAVQDTTKHVTSLLHTMRDRMVSKHIYHVDKGFKAWAKANPTQISEVAQLIKDEKQDSPFLHTLLCVWREVAPSKALQAAISFSRSDRPDAKRQAILALASFVNNDSKGAESVENRLVELATSGSVDDKCNAISAIAQILGNQEERSPRLVATLEKLACQPDAKVQHHLIKGLAHHSNAYPPSLRGKVLFLMKTVQSDRFETVQLIDLVLYEMNLDTERETVFETLTEILGQESGAPSFKDFDSVVHKIQTAAHEVIGWYATCWLLNGQHEICDQVDSLFPPLDMSVYNFKLDEVDLSDAEIFYLIHKVYVYLMFCHGPATSLLCACLMSLSLRQRKLLEQDIASFWLRNFPSDLDLFDAVYKAFPRKGLKASIRRMRRQVDAYQEPLRSLPTNPALRPSTMERRTQSEIVHERNKEINRIVDESSLLSSLVHKSTLLYGRSSVTYVRSGESDEPTRQVIPLQRYHTSSELPHMEVLHPTHLRYLLFQFRRERRPE